MNMFKHCAHDKLCRSTGKLLPLSLLVGLTLLGVTGCGLFQSDPNKTIVTESGEKIDLNDETVKQYVEEWANSKPSIDRLSEMENDLVFLLAEVSKMSDLGQVPGTGIAKTSTTTTSTTTNTQKTAAPFTGATTPATSAAPMVTTQTTTTSAFQPVTTTVTPAPTTFTQTSTGATAYAAGTGAPINTPGQFLCPEPFNNDYKKSIAFVSFP
jgi:cytoskeletal protein RodZ